MEKQDFPGTLEELTSFDGCFFLNPGRKNVSSDTADFVEHVPGFPIFPQIPDVHRFSLEANVVQTRPEPELIVKDLTLFWPSQ